MLKRFLRLARNAVHVRRTTGVPFHHQFDDLVFFRNAIGTGLQEFYLYHLWDRRRPIEERMAYLSLEGHKAVASTTNPAVDVDRLDDKVAAADRFRVAGIPLPRQAGIFQGSPDVLLVPAALRTAADLSQLSAEDWPNGLVIKPDRGEHGDDVIVFVAITRERWRRMDGTTVSTGKLAEWLSARRGTRWRIEERLLPHPELHRVVPDVLSTVRILTLRSPSGRVRFGPASWKMPVNRSGIDNFSGHDGLAAPIDRATGTIGDASDSMGRTRYSSHPVTGVDFRGMRLPGIEDAFQLASRASAVIPELGNVGWDIALTPTGPVLIEGNAWWGEPILQLPQGCGMIRGEFLAYLQECHLDGLLGRREEAVRAWQCRRR